MKLHQLQYFQCLAHYLHYRKASEALYISQPTLSFAIKELEKELGVDLFKKEGRTITLTQEGTTFLNYVTKSFQILEEGVQAISPKQAIQISSIPTAINSFLVPFIIQLQKEHPEINIQFRSEKTQTITQKILDNQYDFGICSKINESQLKYIPLIKRKLVIVFSKENPLAKKKDIELKDLLNYPFYTYQKNMTLYATIKDLFLSQGLPFHPSNYFDDENSMIGLVNANLAVSIMEDNDTLLSYSNIVKKKIPLPYQKREIYIVYHPQHISKLSLKIIEKMLHFHV